MLLHEANSRLTTSITDVQLQAIHPLYCILDLSKDDFCRIVDCIGIDTLVAKASTYSFLSSADTFFRQYTHYTNNLRLISDYETKIATAERECKAFARANKIILPF